MARTPPKFGGDSVKLLKRGKDRLRSYILDHAKPGSLEIETNDTFITLAYEMPGSSKRWLKIGLGIGDGEWAIAKVRRDAITGMMRRKA